jgi:putative intracellular protease/amidase
MNIAHLLVCFGITTVSTLNAAVTHSSTEANEFQRNRLLNLAILIFDGVQIIDYTGPYETFGHAYNNEEPLFNIYTVAPRAETITTAMGMNVNPKYSFANAPKPDVLVVPGGDIRKQLNDQNVIKWVRDSAKSATVTMSVCNGAFILAKAGLLDGLEATTTFGLIGKLREAAPKAKVVDNKRYVDNGKIVTAAGLSSGIDCSLYIIEKLFGKGTAQMAALGMEYNWDPESRFVRAALADKYMQFDFDVKFLPGGWKPLAREGNLNHWENKWLVKTQSSDAELLESIDNTIETKTAAFELSQSKWIRIKIEPGNHRQSLWTFKGEDGNLWKGTVRVEPNQETQNEFILVVRVDRDENANSTAEKNPQTARRGDD